MTGAYRVVILEPDNLWYGYVYSNNCSRVKFSEECSLDLGGLQVSNRDFKQAGTVSKVDLNMGLGDDDIIVLKRHDGNCSFGMKSKFVRH